jgi:hypothetical protein
MARIRTLKPDAFRSRTMKKLSFRARWTFWGLLVQVDDKGRARDDVDLIRADIYPLEMDEVSVKDVETDIAELVIADMVCRYHVGREEYLHIINFAKHQRINRPSESQLPQCPHHSDGSSPNGRSTAPEPPLDEPSLSPHAPLSESSVSPQPSRVRAGSGSGREVEEERELGKGEDPTTPAVLFDAEPAVPSTAADEPQPQGHEATEAKAEVPKTTRRAAPANRGTRVPADFTITPDMDEWGRANCPHVADPVAATAEFVDYWLGVPGSKGNKLDWVATWRNRMRDLEARALERLPTRHSAAVAQPYTGATVIALHAPRLSATARAFAQADAAGEEAKRLIYGGAG